MVEITKESCNYTKNLPLEALLTLQNQCLKNLRNFKWTVGHICKGRQILKGKPSLVISTTFEFPAKTKFKILWLW